MTVNQFRLLFYSLLKYFHVIFVLTPLFIKSGRYALLAFKAFLIPTFLNTCRISVSQVYLLITNLNFIIK